MRQDRIDVHHHVLPRFFREAQTAGGYPSTAYRPFPDWSPETSLALMDRQGIATAILSFSAPGLYYGDRAACRELARRCNDYLAGLIAGHAGRFGAFAALPFPDVDDCLAEIEYAQDIGLDGFMHLTRNDDRPAGHPDFREIYRELDRRAAAVLIHPTYPAESAERDYVVPQADRRLPLRDRAGGGEPAVQRGAGRDAQYPLHPVACRRRAAGARPPDRDLRHAHPVSRELPRRRARLSRAALLRHRALGRCGGARRAASPRRARPHSVRHRLSLYSRRGRGFGDRRDRRLRGVRRGERAR